MGTVMTVWGEVSGGDLGIVDYHEHLCFNAPDWLLREDRDFRLDDVERSAEELRTWAQAGGKTMIEMSAIDFGRNVREVKRIAEMVPDVHVIVITGHNKPYFCDRSVLQADEGQLVAGCIRDILEGIDGTEVKAGIMKGGSGYNTFHEYDQKLLRIAAAVQVETEVAGDYTYRGGDDGVRTAHFPRVARGGAPPGLLEPYGPQSRLLGASENCRTGRVPGLRLSRQG